MSDRKIFKGEDACEIRGKKVHYVATLEEFPLYSDTGEKEANIFTISYERTEVEENDCRPILFAYNGGPGCSSIMVNLGGLAPERVKMGEATSMQLIPPFETEANKECILDICDIVTIDAIGTGYSRLINKDAASKYYNTTGDSASFVNVICRWLTTHDKWNRPIYLMGESYGTIRSAMLADMLIFDNTAGINYLNVSGIISLGSAFDHGQKPYPIDTPILNFTSIAASYWYHNHEKSNLPDRETFLSEADAFAYASYLPALALGNRLDSTRRSFIKERLVYFTGLDDETLESLNLRVDTYTYPMYAMAKEGKFLGRYDGRFIGNMSDPKKFDPFRDDPGAAVLMTAAAHCFHGIWKKKLGVDIEEDYRLMSMEAAPFWSFATEIPPIEKLAKAMKSVPDMKLMLGVGYYDMLTTPGFTEYTAACFDLPADRVRIEKFDAGHMPYLGSAECDRFGEALRRFIEWR